MTPTKSGGEQDALESISSFFKRTSTKIKKKYEETNFKGGAQNLGNSITDTSKRAGSKISTSIQEIKQSEKTQKVKSGFFRFASKVKSLFSSGDKVDEEVKVHAGKNSSQHDKAKADLQSQPGIDEDYGEDGLHDVPEMLKLEGQSHGSSDENEDPPVYVESEESKGENNISGQRSKVLFFQGGQVVRDYRNQEKAQLEADEDSIDST